MTSRERLFKVLNGEMPEHVPVAPDVSNMVPSKLTGKPFWDIYLYQDPPKWKAYIDCVKYFGFDSLMDGYAGITFDDLDPVNNEWKDAIVYKGEERIVTQSYRKRVCRMEWGDTVTVYYRDNPPSRNVKPESINLPAIPDRYEDISGVKSCIKGEALLKLVKDEMGVHGLVGVTCGTSKLIHTQEEIYDYFDNPKKYEERRDRLLEYYTKRFHRLMSLEQKPDFICTGSSGTLIHQSPEIFRKLGLPIVKRMTALAKQYGIPSHLHSCGPEAELVKIVAEETDLTVIDPLETAPMGNCNLRELKKLYGNKLVLKGNLHTTNVMLFGSVKDVAEASKRAIDDAAAGGGFILSTGDQCGRDTPFENIFAMIETAKTYGRYRNVCQEVT